MRKPIILRKFDSFGLAIIWNPAHRATIEGLCFDHIESYRIPVQLLTNLLSSKRPPTINTITTTEKTHPHWDQSNVYKSEQIRLFGARKKCTRRHNKKQTIAHRRRPWQTDKTALAHHGQLPGCDWSCGFYGCCPGPPVRYMTKFILD